MGRKARSGRRTPPVRPLPESRRIEVGPDGYDYQVISLPGARAVKTYRCPGCDHEIRSGTAHVVVWPADLGEGAVDDRRHWHTPCWANRATRSPTRRWS
ncbi:hypothetical protein [Mycolicibacterium tokaiense]|uniref:ATP/GTP-binding protein n=1 Tax=Mycolicibacterium tokaiense TaxID=39695 RepID=A0A378TMS7_9MYCO|nr:hypothetical protein [Mycolicibacterium tokaiense]BBY84329.1 hypothetical protein MTOK_01110 [Mycolicibacterium tokaiense]STZ61163.1 Uncharacterised protein [Mycolicibacterium tokaiense]